MVGFSFNVVIKPSNASLGFRTKCCFVKIIENLRNSIGFAVLLTGNQNLFQMPDQLSKPTVVNSRTW